MGPCGGGSPSGARAIGPTRLSKAKAIGFPAQAKRGRQFNTANKGSGDALGHTARSAEPEPREGKHLFPPKRSAGSYSFAQAERGRQFNTGPHARRASAEPELREGKHLFPPKRSAGGSSIPRTKGWGRTGPHGARAPSLSGAKASIFSAQAKRGQQYTSANKGMRTSGPHGAQAPSLSGAVRRSEGNHTQAQEVRDGGDRHQRSAARHAFLCENLFSGTKKEAPP